MTAIGSLHSGLVFPRRVRRLSEAISGFLPHSASVLDVGCGDGTLDALLLQKRPDLRVEGIDVLVRPDTKIPVTAFDGVRIPHPDRSFDTVLFVDVLHHTDDPGALMREAARVARQCVVIKDHYRDRFLAGPTLRFMDYVGNAHHGVRLPYNYLRRAQWLQHWEAIGLTPAQFATHLNLYPGPFEWLFGRSLQFVVHLEVESGRATAGAC